MKIRLMSVVTLIILLVTSCETDHIKPSEEKEWIRKVQIEEEPELMNALANIGIKSNSGGRTATTSFGELNLAEAIKVLDSDNDATRYSLKLEVSNKNNFILENLVVASKKDQVSIYIIQIEPDIEWLWNNNARSFESFTGVVRQLDLERTVLVEMNITEGSSGSKGGRTQTCCSWQVLTSTTTGLPYWEIKCDGDVYITFRTQDCAGGGISDGTTGGEPYGGDYGSGDYTGGSTDSGGGTTTGGTGTTSTGDKIGIYMTDADWDLKDMIDTWEINQIKDTQLKPCMQTILRDVKNLSQGSVGQIIQKFSGTVPGWNWELKDGSLTGETGQTEPPALYNRTTGTVTTTFDTQAWRNATDLSWARTILHEGVHAYLTVYFATDQQNFVRNYSQMVQDWGTLKNWNSVHHEEFARSLTTAIADALEVYGRSKGYSLPRQFYDDMSWSGLQGTSTFKNLPAADQTRILNTIAIELTGKDSKGNTATQKGRGAGC